MNTHTVFQNHRSFRKLLAVLLLTISIVSICASPARVVIGSASIESIVVLDPTTAPMLFGTSQVMNNGPGDQLDAHVDCDLAAYVDIDFVLGFQWIRYFDFTTNTDHLVPGNGLDHLPDVLGSTIAFTEGRVGGPVIVLFDTVSQSQTVVPGSWNMHPQLGGNLVVYEDFSSSSNHDPSESEISMYDRSTNTVTRLTNDPLSDRSPVVSPTGNAIVWEKCQTNGLGCDIYSAIQTAPGIFTTTALSATTGEDLWPDTNGEIVVYHSNRDGEFDVYFQPVGGGVEMRLTIPGDQRDTRISGNLIAFESFMPDTRQYDVFVYDRTSAKLYRVTNTPVNEALTKVSICNGVGRIVYSAPAIDFDVFAFTFQPPTATENEIEDLIELVRSFDLPNGTENSLVTKLEDALTALEASDTATACVHLSAFISECQAQSGKKLTADQANQLINSATQIKTELGCL